MSFCRLDYSGIAFLIMGSFVPWLYYSFYCSPQPCFIYLIVVCVLGLAAITVSQCDFFATPQYRGVRAGESPPRVAFGVTDVVLPRGVYLLYCNPCYLARYKVC